MIHTLIPLSLDNYFQNSYNQVVKIQKNIKAVIFDVDGLLIDSESSWNKAYEAFLKKHNIVYDPAFSANRRGIGLKHFIGELKNRYQVEDDVDTLLHDYRKTFYEIFSHDARLLEGAEELIKFLHQKKFQLAIATGGHTREEMVIILKKFGLYDYFPLIVSGDEVHKGKPDPEVFLLTAEKLQRESKDCLVLEDSVNGVHAGKAAGMVVFGIISDNEYRMELVNAAADRVFASLSEIIE